MFLTHGAVHFGTEQKVIGVKHSDTTVFVRT